MPHHTKSLNAGESTGSKPVDGMRDPNIRVTNLSATEQAAFKLYRGHSANPENLFLGRSSDMELHAEISFNIECVSGQIRVDWDD